jgi:hypothetical protein
LPGKKVTQWWEKIQPGIRAFTDNYSSGHRLSCHFTLDPSLDRMRVGIRNEETGVYTWGDITMKMVVDQDLQQMAQIMRQLVRIAIADNVQGKAETLMVGGFTYPVAEIERRLFDEEIDNVDTNVTLTTDTLRTIQHKLEKPEAQEVDMSNFVPRTPSQKGAFRANLGVKNWRWGYGSTV